MPQYKVWRQNYEQWDANDIDPPTVIASNSLQDAVECFAGMHNEGQDAVLTCIVQDEAGAYFEVELVQCWEVTWQKPTTLEELCSP